MVYYTIACIGEIMTQSTLSISERIESRVKSYLNTDDLPKVLEACDFAVKAHQGQFRESGEEFIEHPLSTAEFLADLKLDSTTLIAALLHDTLEDCDVTYAQIQDSFGNEVAELVDGVTKLTKAEIISEEREILLEPGSKEDLTQAATIRKMLLAMANDVRIVLIKLADRLHNMKTLKSMPADTQFIKAKETLDVYAPLAHRLGIWEIKWQLEDLAFQYLNPEEYVRLSKWLNSTRADREDYVERLRVRVEKILTKAGIKAEVRGRPKHIYSLSKKIKNYQAQNKTLNEIYDLFALRILVDNDDECYSALGMVHNEWHQIPGQFDDYISNPKDNLYKSLHTTILCEDANPVEIQIRTHEMDKVAEYGVAAHWLYKEGSINDVEFLDKVSWLRQLVTWQNDIDEDREFVESFKTDIFSDQVFVYTPKGELKEFPLGATPLDFAYRIHTDVGHSCIGAKVNKKLVPLDLALANGDVVEIMTSKMVKGPSLDWLNSDAGYVFTTSARAKIRLWFNRQERQINIDHGKEIFAKHSKRLSVEINEALIKEVLKYDSFEDFYAALGNGTTTIGQVIKRITAYDVNGTDNHFKQISDVQGFNSGIEVLGVGDLLTRIAQCCSPINGDQIIGYITRNRGVTVHRSDCNTIKFEQEKERLVSVGWGLQKTVYPARIILEAVDRVGLLSDITSLVSAERVNIGYCVSEEVGDNSVVSLTVYTTGIEQLNTLFVKLEGVKGVLSVNRST